MELLKTIDDINLIAVAVATISTFLVGALWYSWGLFGKIWAEAVGLKKSDVEKSEPMVYLRTAAGSFLASLSLAMLMMVMDSNTPFDGIILGAFVGVVFRVTSMSMHIDFAHHPKSLIVVDGLHDVVQLAVIGCIIGAIQ